MTYAEREVAWYAKRGKFPERIASDRLGQKYVIGDASWNKNKPRREHEIIEPDMNADLS